MISTTLTRPGGYRVHFTWAKTVEVANRHNVRCAANDCENPFRPGAA